MSFNTEWDVNKYKSAYESEEHWELRRCFMETHKNKFPEERLVCLAQVFTNIEFMGCRYPAETMEMVAQLSQGVADGYREKQKTKLQRTFVKASDAAGAKVKGLKRLMGDAADTSDSPHKISKCTDETQLLQNDISSTSDISKCPGNNRWPQATILSTTENMKVVEEVPLLQKTISTPECSGAKQLPRETVASTIRGEGEKDTNIKITSSVPQILETCALVPAAEFTKKLSKEEKHQQENNIENVNVKMNGCEENSKSPNKDDCKLIIEAKSNQQSSSHNLKEVTSKMDCDFQILNKGSIGKEQSLQTGPFGNLILYQSKNLQSPFQTIDFSTSQCNIPFKIEYSAERCCKILINDLVVVSVAGKSKKIARHVALSCAVEKLKDVCYTLKVKKDLDDVVVKMAMITSAAVTSFRIAQRIPLPKAEALNTPLPEDNIGSKLMRSMGWTGGGLGKAEQGIQEPVSLSLKVNRAGLGAQKRRGVETGFYGRARLYLEGYKTEAVPSNLIFKANEFSGEEKKVICRIAKILDLHATVIGKGTEADLKISRKDAILIIAAKMMRCGEFSDENYELFPPRNPCHDYKHEYLLASDFPQFCQEINDSDYEQYDDRSNPLETSVVNGILGEITVKNLSKKRRRVDRRVPLETCVVDGNQVIPVKNLSKKRKRVDRPSPLETCVINGNGVIPRGKIDNIPSLDSASPLETCVTDGNLGEIPVKSVSKKGRRGRRKDNKFVRRAARRAEMQREKASHSYALDPIAAGPYGNFFLIEHLGDNVDKQRILFESARANCIPVSFQHGNCNTGAFCKVFVNNHLLTSICDSSKKKVHSMAVEDAYNKLKQICYVLKIKTGINSDGGPVIQRDEFNIIPANSLDTPLEENIGSKLMRAMGWTEGGLGKNQQGIVEPVRPSDNKGGTGLGFGKKKEQPLIINKKKMFRNRILNFLTEYKEKNEPHKLTFSPKFTKSERVMIHEMCGRLKLSSKSYGEGENRKVIVTQVKEFRQIVEQMLLSGENSNFMYELVKPPITLPPENENQAQPNCENNMECEDAIVSSIEPSTQVPENQPPLAVTDVPRENIPSVIVKPAEIAVQKVADTGLQRSTDGITGPFGSLVLIEDESVVTPIQLIERSANGCHIPFKFEYGNVGKGGMVCRLLINNILVASSTEVSKKRAREVTVKRSLVKLKDVCCTVKTQIKVVDGSISIIKCLKKPNKRSVGCGKDSETHIVCVSKEVDWPSLGMEHGVKALSLVAFKDKVRHFLRKYQADSCPYDLIFSPEFSPHEKSWIQKIASGLALRITKYDISTKDYMVINKKLSIIELAKAMLTSGGNVSSDTVKIGNIFLL